MFSKCLKIEVFYKVIDWHITHQKMHIQQTFNIYVCHILFLVVILIYMVKYRIDFGCLSTNFSTLNTTSLFFSIALLNL